HELDRAEALADRVVTLDGGMAGPADTGVPLAGVAEAAGGDLADGDGVARHPEATGAAGVPDRASRLAHRRAGPAGRGAQPRDPQPGRTIRPARADPVRLRARPRRTDPRAGHPRPLLGDRAVLGPARHRP